MNPRLHIDKERISHFCQEHGIRTLALFGSALRDDFGAESDVDLLVEFEPGHAVGLLRMAGLELELTDLLGRKADLRTPAELSRYFREEVVQTREALYGQG